MRQTLNVPSGLYVDKGYFAMQVGYMQEEVIRESHVCGNARGARRWDRKRPHWMVNHGKPAGGLDGYR